MNLIVAVDKNYGIGKDGKLLCNLPSDLKYFKEKTINKVVVMGRSTLESLPKSKPLPNRVNIVITRNEDYKASDAIIVHSTDELMEELNNFNQDDIYIIGGASIYNEFMERCDNLYVTKIDHEFDPDCYIKNIDELDNFKLSYESEMFEENGYRFKFTIYKRKRV